MNILVVRFLTAVFIGLFLFGCASTSEAEVITPTSTQQLKTPTETAAILAQPEPLPTLISPSMTPEPEEDFIVQIMDMAACEELFCQVAWPGMLERPVAQGDENTIDFSYLYANTKQSTLPPHHGIEFLDANGTPVFAAAPGEVVFAGQDYEILLGPYFGFYGEVVVIRHQGLLFESQDVYTLYGHLSHIDVVQGQFVDTGEKVGEIGMSGFAEGPHLHFEVRLEENDYLNTVNPVLWFEPRVVEGMGQTSLLAGVVINHHGDLVPEFQITLEKIDVNGDATRYFYPETYTLNGINSHPLLGENFAFPDIPAGNYRLSFILGRLYENHFTIDPGSLGFIKIQFD